MPLPRKPTSHTSGRRTAFGSAMIGCLPMTRRRCRCKRRSRFRLRPKLTISAPRGNEDQAMYSGPGVKTSPDFPIPDQMRAWVLGNPGELKLTEKPVPVPKRAEVLVRIDAVAICATDLEIIDHGSPALIEG